MNKATQAILTLPLLVPGLVFAAGDDDLFAMSLEQLAQVSVHIATGTPKALSQAPAVASVITADELAALGATDIDQALELVPGVHVSSGSFDYASRYFIRGIASNNNPHTLVLINGIPMTSLFTGDRGETVATRTGLPVSIIERIEIIRGPGSAVYGADAFSGVINIITKSPDNTDGNEASLAYGSFNSSYASLLGTHQWGEVKTLFSVAHSQSDGDDPIIEQDYQSALDQLFSTNASRAPGPVSLGWQSTDLRADLHWQDWRARASWRSSESETGQGINDALDPNDRFAQHRGTVDLTWSKPAITDHWGLQAQLSYLYYDLVPQGTIQLLPPGAFGGFADGMLQKPGLKEENARSEVVAQYSGWQDHHWRLGGGFFWGDIYQTTDTTNYVLIPGNPAPQETPLQDVTDTPREFLPENQRTLYYLFAQDEWQMADHWALTAGLRYDHYSDVGTTTNPRLALVWQTTERFTSKLLYGEAFRPPAFFELYARSNPVALGNDDLKPERLKSLELAFNWQVSHDLSWDLNLYQYFINDFINLEDSGSGTYTYQNLGRIRGQGAETEWRWQVSRTVQLTNNVSYQRTRDRDTDEPLGLTPNWDGSFYLTWSPNRQWQVTPQVVWVGSTERPGGDPRKKLDGYMTLDLNIRRQLPHNLTLAVIGRNLADADVREASPGPGASDNIVAIPNDLPQPGRSVLVKVSAHW